MGWSLQGRVALAALGLGSAAVVLLSVGCEEGPFLQTEQFVTRAGQDEEQVGSACIPAQKGGGLGGGRAPGVPGAAGEGTAAAASGYSFSYEGTGSGVRLVIADGGGKTLAERHYDAAFISAGRKDELKVETDSETLRFVGWGVAACGK
jgi:hypothetical protein